MFLLPSPTIFFSRRSHKKLQATKEEQNQLKHQLAQGTTRTMEMASIRMGMFVVV